MFSLTKTSSSEIDSAYIHTRRIKLWDLCAPEAVLRASGGRLTQLDGEQILYGPEKSALHSKGCQLVKTSCY